MHSECLTVAYESAQDRLPDSVTADSFSKQFSDWEAVPVVINGILQGAILQSGPELHACIKPEAFKKWLNKSVLKIIQNCIEQYGYAATSVCVGNDTGINFVERLGFKCVETVGNTIYYRKN